MMDYELRHQTSKTLSEGKFYPLGATPRGEGANFAVYSQAAAEVYLLLFDEVGSKPSDIIKVENRTRFIWHTFVHGVKAGQLYGYKMRGEYNPAQGMRFNEHKLLMDPYAKALTGDFRNADNLLLAYDPYSPQKDRVMDHRDNAHIVPLSIVMEDDFDWQGDTPPDIPLRS
jgi:isoamylase